MSSNFKNLTTSDAYQGKKWYILQFFSGIVNVENKDKKPVFLSPSS